MKKGKFGIVLCFYPIAAFAAVILNSPLICLLIAMAAIFVEKDEWTGRQTLQACMASFVVFFFRQLSELAQMFPYIPFLSSLIQVVTTVLYVLMYLAAIVFSVLAVIRVRRDAEANIPLLSELAYHIYGQAKPKPVAPPVPQYPMPYGAPQQPAGQQPVQVPQQPQPYPAQNAYPAAPQYAPPAGVPQQPQPPQPFAPQQPIQQPPQGPGPNGPSV